MSLNMILFVLSPPTLWCSEKSIYIQKKNYGDQVLGTDLYGLTEIYYDKLESGKIIVRSLPRLCFETLIGRNGK